MMSRYKEVAKFVFDYHEHRNPLVRQSITALLPRIAHFLRDRFISSYLKVRHDIIVVFATSMAGLCVLYITLVRFGAGFVFFLAALYWLGIFL